MNADGSAYTNLYSFRSVTDGEKPTGSLTQSGTTLYGMTSTGGRGGCGTIFALTSDEGMPVLLQAGNGGMAGVWGLGANMQPATWSAMNGPLGGGWVLRALNRNRALLQQGKGGPVGIWDLGFKYEPVRWWPVASALPGWVIRDFDGNNVLLQAGDGGMVGVWTLDPANNRPASWTLLSGPISGCNAVALRGKRVLLQYGSGRLASYWFFSDHDSNYFDGEFVPINATLPPGWILRSMNKDSILLQAGDGGMAGLWDLDANGQPSAWHPICGPMPGWIMRGIDQP